MSNESTELEKVIVRVVATLGVIACLAGIGMLLAFPIKWTWNATMPYLFGLPALTWGKAWCVNFLCGVLINRGSYKSEK